MESESYYKMLSRLEDYHDLFSALWEVGVPIFTNSKNISTAAIVKFKDSDQVHLYINESFWNELDDYSRTFIICHEMLHVYLKHIYQAQKDDIPELANIAADIAINHMLCDRFGFTRELVNGYKRFCWVDNFFPGEQIDTNLSWRTYYNLLLKNAKQVPSDGYILIGSQGKSGKGDTDDKELDEEGLTDIANDIAEDVLGKDAKEALSDEESFAQRAGTVGGDTVRVVKVEAKPKRKWETVIHSYARKAIKDTIQEQWARQARRNVLLPSDLFLPSEQEIEDKDLDKIELWFYQDTSGSCVNLAERFFKAARSIPTDKFIIRVFCFDTRVFDVDLKTGKLYGFGGTYFHILEQHVQQKIKEYNVSYPKAIFVVTDGYGSKISPEKPKSWHWFLSTGYDGCIHKDCNIHYLRDFE